MIDPQQYSPLLNFDFCNKAGRIRDDNVFIDTFILLYYCKRSVKYVKQRFVVLFQRVLSGGETGGTALIHDNEMRVTCNFTNSAIEEFEK